MLEGIASSARTNELAEVGRDGSWKRRAPTSRGSQKGHRGCTVSPPKMSRKSHQVLDFWATQTTAQAKKIQCAAQCASPRTILSTCRIKDKDNNSLLTAGTQRGTRQQSLFFSHCEFDVPYRSTKIVFHCQYKKDRPPRERSFWPARNLDDRVHLKTPTTTRSRLRHRNLCW